MTGALLVCMPDLPRRLLYCNSPLYSISGCFMFSLFVPHLFIFRYSGIAVLGDCSLSLVISLIFL